MPIVAHARFENGGKSELPPAASSRPEKNETISNSEASNFAKMQVTIRKSNTWLGVRSWVSFSSATTSQLSKSGNSTLFPSSGMVSLFNIFPSSSCVCVCVCVFLCVFAFQLMQATTIARSLVSTAAMVGRSISRSAQDRTKNVPSLYFSLSLSLSPSPLFARGGVCHTLFHSVGKRSEKCESERVKKERVN